MIRWATEKEAESDVFKHFRARHTLVDRHDNRLRTWEYPWAFYQSLPAPGLDTADIGSGYSPFLEYIQREVTYGRFFAVDPAYKFHVSQPSSHDPTSDSERNGLIVIPMEGQNLHRLGLRFDRIYCISLLEHLTPIAQQKLLKSITKCLAPLGILVITVDYFLDWHSWLTALRGRERWPSWLPIGGNIDIENAGSVTGLSLLEPCTDSPHILNRGVDYYLGEAPTKKLLVSRHTSERLPITSRGIVLFRPFLRSEVSKRLFKVATTTYTNGCYYLPTANGTIRALGPLSLFDGEFTFEQFYRIGSGYFFTLEHFSRLVLLGAIRDASPGERVRKPAFEWDEVVARYPRDV